MATYPGRIESKFTAPSGTTCSVSTGALTSAVTVTTAAADYYHSAAGGISAWPTVFQTALNAAITPYPQSAAAMQAAVGYGTWSAGWGFDIASGNDTGLFGGVTMTSVSTPGYSTTGPGNGGDKAVTFNSANDAFSAGANFNVTTDDLIIAWVGKFSSSSANADIFAKFDTGTAKGYTVIAEITRVRIYVGGAGAGAFADVSDFFLNEWHVGIAVIDKNTNRMRIGLRSLSGTSSISAETDTSAVGSLTNASNFLVGDKGGYGAGTSTPAIAGLYVATGAGVATGLSANLSTALTNFANAVNSSFTVSLDTSSATGRYTISNSFYPFDLAWTNVDQRSLAGYDRDITYPATAAQMAAALGTTVAEWEAAWLCNETSGDLAAAFGGVTLADVSTPSYSSLGPRGGTDKAVGFDSASDAFFIADTFNVTATEDLAILMVVNFSTVAGNADLLAKGAAAAAGYILVREGATVALYACDGVDTASVSCAVAANTWYALCALLERATNTVRIGVVPIFGSASPTVSSAASASSVGSMSNGGNFNLGNNAVYNAGGMTIAYAAVSGATGGALGLSDGLSTALTSFAAYMKSQTGTAQARGLWFPDSPLNCDDHPSMAPEETDVRMTESPTGNVLGLAGNRKYVHTNVRYQRVPVDRIRESSATYANASLEVFFRDAVSGIGAHEWMGPASDLQVYWQNAGVLTLLGGDSTHAGWKPVGVYKFSDLARPSQEGWVGAFDVRFPRLVSDG